MSRTLAMWVSLVALFAVLLPTLPYPAHAGSNDWRYNPDALPYYLRDRGRDAIPTSMFGTYVNPGELLVYPFFEFYGDNNYEYSPNELGYGVDMDYRGDYEASEGLIFLGYGLTRSLCLEVEAAVITAELEPSPDDPATPAGAIQESGLGDVQTQLNWLFMRETESRPAAFSFLEVVYPLQKSRVLIGTSEWEFKLGAGLIRGFHWGTMMVRAAAEYNQSESAVELGEIAASYLKRLSPNFRVYFGVEGTQDEWELIPELQIFASKYFFFKLNSAVGLSSKATGWAPEVGVMFTLPIAEKFFKSPSGDAQW